jgi:hypothetical protein
MNAIITFIISVLISSNLGNIGLVEQFTEANYKECEIVYFTEWGEEIENRANSNLVYVQIEKSISSGEVDEVNGKYWGYIEGSTYYKTWYNEEVEKGKEVTSYYIYNPYNNYEDDITAVIDNEKIR